MEAIILAKYKKTYTLMKSIDHKMAQSVKKTRIVCGTKMDGNFAKKNLMLQRDFVHIKIYFQ